MKISLEINDTVLAELMLLTGARTGEEAVNLAIARQIERQRALAGLLSMRGKVDWEGDLAEIRRDR